MFFAGVAAFFLREDDVTRVKFPGFLKASRRGGEAEVSPGVTICGG